MGEHAHPRGHRLKIYNCFVMFCLLIMVPSCSVQTSRRPCSTPSLSANILVLLSLGRKGLLFPAHRGEAQERDAYAGTRSSPREQVKAVFFTPPLFVSDIVLTRRLTSHWLAAAPGQLARRVDCFACSYCFGSLVVVQATIAAIVTLRQRPRR